jgi:cobalt-precorrin-6B (C15)-methyltransferase
MIYPSGTPTQPEIITVALSKLDIRPEHIFADVGCGSGSVSIRASKLAKHVYAIDRRDEAISAAAQNFREYGLNNVSALKGEASELLLNLEVDRVFLGGSKNVDHVLEILMKKVPRFVVSAVRLETVVQVINMLKKNHQFKESIQLQLSRGSELAGGIMLKPENPVFLIVGGTC